MANEFVWSGAMLLIGGRSFACQYNEMTVSLERELKERTALCDTWRRRVPGLKSLTGSMMAYWANEAAASSSDNMTGGQRDASHLFDDDLWTWAANASTGRVFAIAPSDPTVNSASSTSPVRAYHGQAVQFGYQLSGQVGELGMVESELSPDGPFLPGYIVYSQQSTAASTQGQAFTLGAVPTGYAVYGSHHVRGSTSGSQVVSFQSSTDVASFAAATTRATFAALSSTGAIFQKIADGPITDTAWQVVLAGSTNPSFRSTVILGIGKATA